jgi:hypothetical protein
MMEQTFSHGKRLPQLDEPSNHSAKLRIEVYNRAWANFQLQRASTREAEHFTLGVFGKECAMLAPAFIEEL